MINKNRNREISPLDAAHVENQQKDSIRKSTDRQQSAQGCQSIIKRALLTNQYNQSYKNRNKNVHPSRKPEVKRLRGPQETQDETHNHGVKTET